MSVARSIVPPDTAPAPTVEWISSMKRMAFGLAASALMTALKRSSKSPRKRVPASSAPVSSAKTSASFSAPLEIVIVGQQARGETFGHRGLADAGVADEHRIVLAAPAEDFDRALQFVGAADERIEQTAAGAVGQVETVRAERIARGRRSLVARPGWRGVLVGVAAAGSGRPAAASS